MSNLKFATFRLGKTSVQDIQTLNRRSPGVQTEAYSFVVTCTQVPEELTVGAVVFIWLGSDNSKGAPTDWKQGFKGIGLVKALDKAEKYNDESHTTIELKYVFKDAVNRLDILRESPDAYFWCSALPIIGLEDHSNQTARVLVESSERTKIGAFLLALNAVQPTFRAEIVSVIPDMADYFWNHVPNPKTGTLSEASANQRDGDNAPRQLIIYGAPGTGKSWRIKNDTQGMRVIRTTFHPDSDYSTFVGAYKPSMEDMPRTFMKGEEIAKVTQGDECLFQEKRIVYKFVAQAFLKAYVEAWKKMVMGGTLAENAENAEGCPASENSARGSADATERVPPVYLVIEEINRGNCAQIFGDLFQLLDRNDDGFSEYEIAADDDLRRYLAEAFRDVRGAALAAAGDSRPPSADAMNCVPPEVAEKMERVFKGEILLLPENLFILATMNTSDQSLFPIDSAFKRRWEWKYMPIHDAQKGYRIAVGADAYDWWDFLDKANALVQDFTDSEDKKLGYFFCKANPDGTIPLERFVGKVVFYLWNDVFRDVGFDHEVFAGGTGGRLLFKDFFNPDGSPRSEAVRQFLANLGVARVVSDGNIAGDASSASEAVAEGVSA